MPNTKSARKRLRQNRSRRLRNRSIRSEIRTRTKRILEAESYDEAASRLSRLYALLDRAGRKGVVHPNAAARHKGRIARHVRRLAGD